MDPKRVQEFLDLKINQGVFTGASVIFGKPFEKVIEVHRGMLGKDINEPVRSTTLFDLQSITKTVATAVLFLKLKADGKVGLDTPVSKHLEESSPLFDGITFKHLLTHSSGLSDNDLAGEFATPEDLWKKMLSPNLSFQPGEGIEYTDLGYRVLGKALENILGMNLNEAARKLIWKPLGLNRMTYVPNDIQNTAATPDAHGIIDDEQVHFLGGVLGCDGVFSNAEDLFTLMSSILFKSEVFSADTIKMITENKADTGSSLSNFFDTLAIGPKNLGWEVNPAPISYAGPFQTGNVIEKAGGAGTFIWMDPVAGYMMVYLTNHGKPKPFDEGSWNNLVTTIAPNELSKIFYENV